MKLIYGHVIAFNGDPQVLGAKAVTEFAAGAVVIGDGGRIDWVGERADVPGKYAELSAVDYGGKYIMAGFIDPHLHFPQYRMLAAPGKDLMDWLTRFTFKEEARYGDDEHAKVAADKFFGFLLKYGTTSVMAFSSVHKGAADALFCAAEARNMAVITGKTMMDRNAPDAVLDTAEIGGIESEELLQKWHGKGRLRYAITPRFALTSSEAQMAVTGELFAKYPDCYMQTHLSESLKEIEIVKRLFPDAKDYTDVYDRYGLLGEKSFFGHGIHLSERECAVLSESGSTVVHCPTSNTFLGSGLLSLAHLGKKERPVKVGLATDIGGGTSYSMLHTIGEAFKVASFNGVAFGAYDGFYMATLGNAKHLGLDGEMGAVKAGNWADIIVIDPRATELLDARQDISKSTEDALFALAILGDDRAICATYVAGKMLYEKS